MSSTQTDLTGLKKFIFTFGVGQQHEGYCQPIYAKDWSTARHVMCEMHGEKWGFQYTNAMWERFKADPNRMWEMEKELMPIVATVDACEFCGDSGVEFQDDIKRFTCPECYDEVVSILQYEGAVEDGE